jgi:hypothetical protein
VIEGMSLTYSQKHNRGSAASGASIHVPRP